MDWFLALLLFLAPLAYSPGPGNLVFAAIGARDGWLGSVPASVGYHLATLIVTLVTGFGFALMATKLPGVFVAIRWAGVLYVLWLALRFAQSGALTDSGAFRRMGMQDGAVLLVLNPKAWVIISLMFSQFLPVSDPAPALVVLISVVFTLNNLVAFAVWTVAGQVIGRLFADARSRGVNSGFAMALAAVALWMSLQ